MNDSPKIRILVVNPTAELGGGTIMANAIVKGNANNELDFFVFFPCPGQASRELVGQANVHVIIANAPTLIVCIPKLLWILRSSAIDVVHAHGTRAAFWIKLAFLLLRKKPKFIYTLHGLHIAYRPFWQKMPLLLLERISNILVDGLVCVSETVEKMARTYSIIDPSRIILIRNGIDVERFKNATPIDPTIFGIPQDAFIITAIQRLIYPKDVVTVIRAFSIARKVFPQTVLLIVGSGPEEKNLKRFASELNLSQRIFFAGARTDIPEILAASHVVVLSSRFESLGLSLLEGMTAGKPVIGMDVDGIREIIQDGKNGFLVPFGDAQAMAQKMVLLLRDASLRQRMGQAGFAYTSQNFTRERMVEGYGVAYRALLSDS